MATREYEFTVGPETDTQPTVGTPTDSDDLITKSYADANYGGGSVNKLGDAGYTVLDDDGYNTILVGQSANMTADRTVTLPTAADNDGRFLIVTKMDATEYVVTVDGEGSEQVGPNSATSVTLDKPGDSVYLLCDAAKWSYVGSWNQSAAPREKTRVHSVSSAVYAFTNYDGYDTLIMTTGASDRTATLPDPVHNVGREILVKKDDSAAGRVLLTENGSETIDGFSQIVAALQYDYVKVKCDGTTWNIVDRRDIGSTGSTTVTGTWTSNTTYTAFETRRGDWAYYDILIELSGAPTTTTISVNLPTGRTINTAKLAGGTGTNWWNSIPFSQAKLFEFGTATIVGQIVYKTTSQVGVQYYENGANGVQVQNFAAYNDPFNFNNTDKISMQFAVPISEWADIA